MADPELFTLLAAVLSDDAKAKTLVEIQEREVKAREAEAAAELKLGEVRAALAESQRLKAEAEAMHQNVAGKHAVLEAYESTLSDHNQTLIAEKAAWEKIRQQVDAEQKDKGEMLAKWEAQMRGISQDLSAREVECVRREKVVEALAAESAMRIRQMRAVLDADSVAPQPPAEEPTKDAA